MREELEEGLINISGCLINIIDNAPLSIIKGIRDMAKQAKSISDSMLLDKLAIFLTYGGKLSEQAETEFNKKILFSDKDDKRFFMELLLYLNKVDEERKIYFFAMLCRARVECNLDIGIYEKIYKTIVACTVTELEYIRKYISVGITETESTITLFSLMQGGLIQKIYNEKEKCNRFYFTKYAGIVYNYALNYNGINDGRQLNLSEITIHEDDYTINKVAKLDDIKYLREPIEISDIKPIFDFRDKRCGLKFIIANTGIKLEPTRLYFSFVSSGGYYVCRRFVPGKYDGGYRTEGKQFHIQYEFDKGGLKTAERFGIVFFFKITNQENRYIKIFHYYNGYINQEISKESYEKEIEELDSCFAKLNSETNDFYIRLASTIMNYDYTK